MKLDNIKIWTVGCCFLFSLVCATSCKKLVAVAPPNSSLNGASVYLNNTSAAAVLTGVYEQMSAGSFTGGYTGLSVICGLSADELSLLNGYSSPYPQLYENNLTNQYPVGPWDNIYTFLETVNAALEGLSASNSLNPSVKNQLLGEAKFLRSFYFFYLVNLYGNVPLTLTSDWQTNSTIAQSSQPDVWKQIVSDCRDAQTLLSKTYLDASLLNTTSDRARPTYWAATALLSRIYLYEQEWDSAEAQSTILINNPSLFSLDTLNGVFLSNSTEAIWQLIPDGGSGFNTTDGQVFVLTAPPSFTQPFYLSPLLLKAFEPGDNRRADWVDSVTSGSDTFYFPYKYKVSQYGAPVTEYLMVMRLAEQYLIRAEARAELNDIGGAQADLNVIRNRAGLGATGAGDEGSLIRAIMHERQIELFSEWGNRWLDLKRTAAIDSVMNVVTPYKSNGGSWQTDQQLYPIFYQDIKLDDKLVQNPGY